MASMMSYESEEHTGVDRADNVCGCDCRNGGGEGPATYGERGGCDGGDTGGDSERRYVPEIRVIKQGVVKRRGIGRGRQW